MSSADSFYQTAPARVVILHFRLERVVSAGRMLMQLLHTLKDPTRFTNLFYSICETLGVDHTHRIGRLVKSLV